MIRFHGKVVYSDGESVEWEGGAHLLAEWELYALRHGYPVNDGAPGMLMQLVVAHTALGVTEGVDVWRKRIRDFEFEGDGVPPTLPEPRPVSMSSSRSPSDGVSPT